MSSSIAGHSTNATDEVLHQQTFAEDDDGTSVAEKVFVDSGNEKKVLYLLCVGLRDSNGNDLFSFDDEPWSLLPKTVMRPQSKDYAKEILRRATLFAIRPLPRPMNWPRSRQIEWLEDNAIKDEADTSFLMGEVSRFKEVAVRTTQEQHLVDLGCGASARGGSYWRGNIPYLRMIMCLTEDSIKTAFLTRAFARSRAELDARNSESR
jgi:hypothetical protein